jgi:hypothetical protein
MKEICYINSRGREIDTPQKYGHDCPKDRRQMETSPVAELKGKAAIAVIV